MPLPKPKDGEEKEKWIERCMSNDAMKEEFPDNKQRLAVCHQKWRDKDKKAMEIEEVRDATEENTLLNEFEEVDAEEVDDSPTSRNIERRYINDIELRLVDDGDGDGENVITGYAAVFNKWSEDLGFFKEKIDPGTFKKTIAESDIRALINHDPNLLIGRTRNKTLKLWEDDKGLGFEVKLPETSYAADLIASIKRKDITQNSFGFKTVQDSWSEDGKKRILKEAMLFDISPVTFPAYKQTTVKMRLHEIGIDFDALNMALIRAERGVVTNSDVDLFHSTIEILKRYIPVDEEPLIEIVEDPEHSEDPKEPESISTQIKVRLADMVLKKYL